METIKTVVIVMAMKQEATPFIDKHKLSLSPPPSPHFLSTFPFRVYHGFIASSSSSPSPSSSSSSPSLSPSPSTHVEVYLVYTGEDERYKVNNVATSVVTYAAISAYSPCLVLSAGTAGGFSYVGGKVGDVYLSTKCVFHARRIPSKGQYEEYGFGHFRSPFVAKLAETLGVKLGVVSTSDCLDVTPLDLSLMKAEGAAVKEMEAAGCAWVCQQAGVPFLAVKSITDIVDGPKTVEEEFYQNLEKASQSLQCTLSQLLSLLPNTSLSDWDNCPSPAPQTPSSPSPSPSPASSPSFSSSSSVRSFSSTPSPSPLSFGPSPFSSSSSPPALSLTPKEEGTTTREWLERGVLIGAVACVSVLGTYYFMKKIQNQ